MRIGILAVIAVAFTPSIASAQLDQKQAQAQLNAFLLNRTLVAKVTFPAWKDGIDLTIDGGIGLRMATRDIKDHGVGIEPGDRVSVTAVKLKDKSIEVHLNGGGAGTMMDALMTSDAKKRTREASGGKLPGGSRINLQFGRAITVEDLADLTKLAAYLEPVVDTASLRQVAMQQAIPEEFKQAAAQKRVVEGMDKATVFAIMGEPKSKTVDVSSDVPSEKWVFELPDLKTRVLTFKGGKVASVVEF